MAGLPRVHIRGRLGPGRLVLEGDAAGRLAGGMKLRPGDRFLVFAGEGHEYLAVVDSVGDGALQATVGEVTRYEPPPSLTVEVWCPSPPAQRFERAIELCTEAGTDVICPLRPGGRGNTPSPAQRERWEHAASIAAEQSGRLYLPVVGPEADLSRPLMPGRTLVLVDRGGSTIDGLRALLPTAGHVILAAAPDAGFPEDVAERAERSGALHLSPGPHVFRSETAAAIATALVRAATDSRPAAR